MLSIILAAVCLVGVFGAPLEMKVERNCMVQFPTAGLSARYHENMAHAAHSMTVQGLRIFNQKATIRNNVPTVNLNVSDPRRVLDHAPDVPQTKYYTTHAMRAVDTILLNVGKENDGLGEFWSPVERVAHYFHMYDLWQTIRLTYDRTVLWDTPSDALCHCVNDVAINGVRGAVQWVAEHYKSGTPITLLDKPIPKLTGADTWLVWRERLHHYYTESALKDAAVYMYCATKDM